MEYKVDFDLNPRKFEINPIVLAVFFGGLLLLSIGLGMVFFKGQKGDDVQIISSGSQVAGEKVVSEIMVHVDGAVVRPGVYKLSSNARVDDAVKAAGGMSGDADTKSVNLAAKIADGQKIYVLSQSANFKIQNGGGETGASHLISINSGTQPELESLPGIGPVTAQKIISLRPYSGVEDLLSKKAVNNAVYQKIKDLVSF